MQILDDGRLLRLDPGDTGPTDPPGSLDVAALWLRDACHCPTCRRPSTNERRVDPTDLDPDVRVSSAELVDDVIVVDTTDGHRARVPSALVHRSASPQQVVVAATELRRMDVAALADRLPDLLDRLAADGAVVVTGVPTTDDGLRSVAELLGPVHATNYGETWTIDAVIDPVSEVESNRALLVHTDLPYRTEPPGVQLLLACRTDVVGGDSTLVDGVAAAERLRQTDPDAFDLLASVPVAYPYVRDDVEIVASAPLIELDHRSAVRIIRRAPDLMGSPTVVADETGRFYAALTAWWAMLDDPASTLTVPLEPGELVVFDNHRMLHGRTAFELGSGGRRVLRGCYVHRDDVASRHAVLRRGRRAERG